MLWKRYLLRSTVHVPGNGPLGRWRGCSCTTALSRHLIILAGGQQRINPILSVGHQLEVPKWNKRKCLRHENHWISPTSSARVQRKIIDDENRIFERRATRCIWSSNPINRQRIGFPARTLCLTQSGIHLEVAMKHLGWRPNSRHGLHGLTSQSTASA